MDSGPHAFLPESHNWLNSSHLFPAISPQSDLVTDLEHKFYSDSDLKAGGFNGNRKIWTGPAGMCFLRILEACIALILPVTLLV